MQTHHALPSSQDILSQAENQNIFNGDTPCLNVMNVHHLAEHLKTCILFCTSSSCLDSIMSIYWFKTMYRQWILV